jgi:hypothetical protein
MLDGEEYQRGMQNSRQSCMSSCARPIVSNSSVFSFRLRDLVDLCSSGVSRIYTEKRTNHVEFSVKAFASTSMTAWQGL